MPQAAAHILFPLIIMSLIRDYYIDKKNRKSFPLHYVLIAGIAGIIPDLDILAYWILYFFGFSINEIHRTFMHSIFVPIIFLILALATIRVKEFSFRRSKLRWSIIFVMLAFGSFLHLVLDSLLHGSIIPFYPLNSWVFGIDLFGLLPPGLEGLAAPCLDAGLIIIYLIYLELKHRISDFI